MAKLVFTKRKVANPGKIVVAPKVKITKKA